MQGSRDFQDAKIKVVLDVDAAKKRLEDLDRGTEGIERRSEDVERRQRRAADRDRGRPGDGGGGVTPPGVSVAAGLLSRSGVTGLAKSVGQVASIAGMIKIIEYTGAFIAGAVRGKPAEQLEPMRSIRGGIASAIETASNLPGAIAKEVIPRVRALGELKDLAVAQFVLTGGGVNEKDLLRFYGMIQEVRVAQARAEYRLDLKEKENTVGAMGEVIASLLAKAASGGVNN